MRNNKIISEQLIAPTNKNIDSYFEKEIAIRIGFEKYKPINLVNQFEYGIAANAFYLENKKLSKYYRNDSLVSDISNKLNEKGLALIILFPIIFILILGQLLGSPLLVKMVI